MMVCSRSAIPPKEPFPVPVSGYRIDRRRIAALLAGLGGALLLVGGVCLGIEPPGMDEVAGAGPASSDLAFLEYV
jgi:hypothetical protein